MLNLLKVKLLKGTTKLLSKYEVSGDVAYLYLTKKGSPEEYIVKIDSADLPKILRQENWYICTTNGLRAWTFIINAPGDYTYVLLYRFILDVPKELTVDHINNDPMDNRRCNLRVLTQAENNQNWDKLRSNNTSGVRGVYYVANRDNYTVRIRIPEGPYKSFGYFNTLEEATDVANKMYKKYQPYSKQAQPL